MTESMEVPRHLKVLRDGWATLTEHLARKTVAPMRVVMEVIVPTDVPELAAKVTVELSALEAWIARVTDWLNGPLAKALGDPAISDQDMRRIAGRLTCYSDELIERRQWLLEHFGKQIIRAAAPRLDRVYFSLLQQLRSFAIEVIAGMDALSDSVTRPGGARIDLSFTFKPDVTAEFAALSACIRRTEEGLRRPRPVSMPNVPPARKVPAESVTLGLIWSFVAAVFIAGFAAILIYPVWAFLIGLLIAFVVLIIRHPLIVLLAFILGF